MKKACILLIVITALFSSHLVAGISTDIGLVSRYIWRGMDLLPDNTPAIQPSFTYEFGKSGFSAILWCSFALADRDIFKNADEIDLTLDYTFNPTEQLSLSLGLNSYHFFFADNFKFGDNTTQEIYATLGFKKVMFSPTVSIFYDFNLGDGVYFQLAGSHSIKLGEKLNLDLSAQLGYNGKQYINKSGLSDLVLGASVPLKAGKITIAPFFNVAFIFMDVINADETEIWFGANISL